MKTTMQAHPLELFTIVFKDVWGYILCSVLNHCVLNQQQCLVSYHYHLFNPLGSSFFLSLSKSTQRLYA